MPAVRWVQSGLGIMFLILGSLHMAFRDRQPQSRSFYVGAIGFSSTARTVFAVTELLLGATLLVTA